MFHHLQYPKPAVVREIHPIDAGAERSPPRVSLYVRSRHPTPIHPFQKIEKSLEKKRGKKLRSPQSSAAFRVGESCPHRLHSLEAMPLLLLCVRCSNSYPGGHCAHGGNTKSAAGCSCCAETVSASFSICHPHFTDPKSAEALIWKTNHEMPGFWQVIFTTNKSAVFVGGPYHLNSAISRGRIRNPVPPFMSLKTFECRIWDRNCPNPIVMSICLSSK